MSIERIGVVGAGQMGNGIAHVAALSGFGVVLSDVSRELVDKALAVIGKNMDRQVAKGTITADVKAEALARIVPAVGLADLASCQLVVEAVVEDLDVKTAIFRELDRGAAAETILASNTSSISITKLAATTKRADRFIGMHFMNPVPVMQLVEVIRGIATSDETFKAVEATATRMGKIAGRGQRLPRVRLQPGPDADDQRGDLRGVRGRGHAAGRSTP